MRVIDDARKFLGKFLRNNFDDAAETLESMITSNSSVKWSFSILETAIVVVSWVDQFWSWYNNQYYHETV